LEYDHPVIGAKLRLYWRLDDETAILMVLAPCCVRGEVRRCFCGSPTMEPLLVATQERSRQLWQRDA